MVVVENEITRLVERRSRILGLIEIDLRDDNDPELEDIEERLARLRAKEQKRLEQEKKAQLAERARNTGILRDLRAFLEEIESDPDHVYATLDAERAGRLLPYILHIRPDTLVASWNGICFIATLEEQRKDLRTQLERRMERRIREQIELQRQLDYVRARTGGEDADGKRDH